MVQTVVRMMLPSTSGWIAPTSAKVFVEQHGGPHRDAELAALDQPAWGRDGHERAGGHPRGQRPPPSWPEAQTTGMPGQVCRFLQHHFQDRPRLQRKTYYESGLEFPLLDCGLFVRLYKFGKVVTIYDHLAVQFDQTPIKLNFKPLDTKFLKS